MARAKDDLSKLSINQLETLTGATFRSIKKYLSAAGLEPLETTDNSIFYDPREALPIIFEKLGYKIKQSGAPVAVTDEEEANLAKVLDPFVQRARKDRAQANKAEFELEVLRSKYVLATEVEQTWSSIMTDFRVKVLGFSSTETPTLFRIKDIKEFQVKFDDLMRELLEELSSYEERTLLDDDADEPDDEDDSGEDDVEGEAADQDDGIGMGSEEPEILGGIGAEPGEAQ